MSPSPHTVLVAVVSIYGDSGDPVTAGTLADSLQVPEQALAEPLDTLCEFDLLAGTGDGYRPTVTARELLALDVELDDVLVLDLVGE